MSRFCRFRNGRDERRVSRAGILVPAPLFLTRVPFKPDGRRMQSKQAKLLLTSCYTSKINCRLHMNPYTRKPGQAGHLSRRHCRSTHMQEPLGPHSTCGLLTGTIATGPHSSATHIPVERGSHSLRHVPLAAPTGPAGLCTLPAECACMGLRDNLCAARLPAATAQWQVACHNHLNLQVAGHNHATPAGQLDRHHGHNMCTCCPRLWQLLSCCEGVTSCAPLHR